mmetsp:Transcript_17115/g.28140  ORF Transcript_17115/g.28140 Transcript_17115/m.28140 type:complete len:210 (-) Transcript_17115:1538-2167(-)
MQTCRMRTWTTSTLEFFPSCSTRSLSGAWSGPLMAPPYILLAMTDLCTSGRWRLTRMSRISGATVLLSNPWMCAVLLRHPSRSLLVQQTALPRCGMVIPGERWHHGSTPPLSMPFCSAHVTPTCSLLHAMTRRSGYTLSNRNTSWPPPPSTPTRCGPCEPPAMARCSSPPARMLRRECCPSRHCRSFGPLQSIPKASLLLMSPLIVYTP